jgi:hypothetical protein
MYKVRNSFGLFLGLRAQPAEGNSRKVRTTRKFVPHLLLKAFAKLRSFGEVGKQ